MNGVLYIKNNRGQTTEVDIDKEQAIKIASVIKAGCNISGLEWVGDSSETLTWVDEAYPHLVNQ